MKNFKRNIKSFNLVLGLISALAVGHAFADDVPTPIAHGFDHPFEQLKNGPVSFSCREPGTINGTGAGILEFDLSLQPPKNPKSPFTMVTAENIKWGWMTIGNQKLLNQKIDYHVGGTILSAGTQYERLNIMGSDNIRSEGGKPGRLNSFELQQDLSTKIVFARIKVSVVAPSPDDCVDTILKCNPQLRIFDNVYMCEPK